MQGATASAAASGFGAALHRIDAQLRTSLTCDGYATAARYDRRRSRVVVRLNTGVELTFPTDLAQGLKGADTAALEKIEISPSGLGLHWPELDADLSIPGLLEGVFGGRTWMASKLGALSGKSRSDAKARAARANGRLGGRPRKNASG